MGRSWAQGGPKTAPSGHGASQGRPREAKIIKKQQENNYVLPSRLFAFNGLLKPQDGPKMAQESPKTGPREAQDGPKSAQDRPKNGPRGPQEATFRAPTGGQRKRNLPSLIDGLQDSPKRPPRPFQRAPRGPQQRPKRAQRRPQEATEPPKDAPERPKSLKNQRKINVFGHFLEAQSLQKACKVALWRSC